jgi:hypothetical protein
MPRVPRADGRLSPGVPDHVRRESQEETPRENRELESVLMGSVNGCEISCSGLDFWLRRPQCTSPRDAGKAGENRVASQQAGAARSLPRSAVSESRSRTRSPRPDTSLQHRVIDAHRSIRRPLSIILPERWTLRISLAAEVRPGQCLENRFLSRVKIRYSECIQFPTMAIQAGNCSEPCPAEDTKSCTSGFCLTRMIRCNVQR